jgi:hypothetical protein
MKPSALPTSVARPFRAGWLPLALVSLLSLTGCSASDSDPVDEELEDASASLVESEGFAPGRVPSGGEAVDAGSERNPLDPGAEDSKAAPGPGDLRSEPEPDPWNPGGDPSKSFGPQDT